jgi:parallel beta-helix repeat protein
VRDFTVTGCASTTGAFTVLNGESNTVGGCTVRNSAGGIMLSGGHHNRVVGNDIYDVSDFHISTSTNPDEELVHAQAELVPTDNWVTNNHLTQ